MPAPTSTGELVAGVAAQYPLPRIEGGKATWVLASAVPLAVIAQEWREPRLLSHLAEWVGGLDWEGETLRLHFSYLAQQRPETVHEVVRELRLRAISK